MFAPYRRFYQQQRRHCDGLAVEDGRDHLAAASLDLLPVVGQALPGRYYVIDDNDLFPFNIARDAVVPFQDALLAALNRVQAFPRLEHIDIVQSRCQFRSVLTDISVEALEPSDILRAVTARHEHDVVRPVFRLQGGHARLEELDTVYIALLETV